MASRVTRAAVRTARDSSTAAVVVAIVACGAAIAAAVGIAGNFPLSDDWSYAFTTRELCQTGSLSFLPWTGASLVFQAGYGAGLCKVFGFSFTVLRASTVVLAIGGAVGLFLLLGRVGVGRAGAAFAATVFGLSPLYVNLAFTFMTDVPFTAILVWAAYAYVRGLEDGQRVWLWLGAALCVLALLTRQHGILLAAAAAVAVLSTTSRDLSRRVGDAAAAASLPAIAFVAFQLWLVYVHGAPAGLSNKVAEAGAATLVGVANTGFRALETLGLLLLPLAVALARREIRDSPRTFAMATALLAAPAIVLFVREGALMPYLTNVVYDFGLGALTLRDTLFLGTSPPEQLGIALQIATTIAATLSAAVLITALARSTRRSDPAVTSFLLMAAGALFAGSLLHTRFYFDRYLLPVLPFALAALLATRPRLRPGRAALVALGLIAWYAVAGTHDYLAWNRARHSALAELAAAGVSAREIDGGVEYNAWKLAAELGTWPTTEEARPGQPADRKSWWWVVDDAFVVSFAPLAGYAVRDEVKYRRWLVPGDGRIVVGERVAAVE